MIICSNCQKTNEDQQTVCVHCGHSLKDEAAATVETVHSHGQQPVHEQKVETVSSQGVGITVEQQDASSTSAASAKEKLDPYLQKGKVVANDYWSYFLDKWKSPVINGLGAKSNQRINGLITLIGFVLFFSLFTVVITRGIRIGIFGGGSGFGMFFSSLIHTSLLVGITLVMLWVAAKFFVRKDVGFMDVLARYGALTVVPASLTVVSFLLALMTLIQLSLLILMFVIIGWITAVTITAYTYHREAVNPGMDPLYCLFIVFGAIGLYVYLFSDSMVTSVFRFM